jgi:hypothetical protein
MRALLLRVGIDKGSCGTYGLIFDDGSFEFVPLFGDVSSMHGCYVHRKNRQEGKTAIDLCATSAQARANA